MILGSRHFLNAAKAAGLQAWQATGGARAAILMYHGVVPAGTRPRLWTQLERPLFAQHLRYLAEHRPVVSLAHLLDALDGRRALEPGSVALTFDDGYFNVLEQAVPELLRFGLPATVFVTAGYLPDSGLLWFDALYDAHAGSLERPYPAVLPLARNLKGLEDGERQVWLDRHFASLGGRPSLYPGHPRRLVDAEELRRLAETPGITIGAHGLTHGILPRMVQTQIQEELILSRQRLEQLLGRTVDLFAWPDGATGPGLSELVIKAGFRAALGTRLGLVMPQDDRFDLRRLPLGADQTLRRFQRTLLGMGCVAAPLRQLWNG